MLVKIGPYKENKDRKIKVKIHDYDTWNGDETLALVILPLLKKIRKNKISAPLVDNSDLPKELAAKDEDEFWEDRWHYVLDEMIWTFTQLLPEVDWESQFHSGNIDFEFMEIEENGKKMYKMVEGPNHTAEFDQEGYTKYNDRINNGMRLFGRYCRCLWT